jgi:hypothetical protein
MYTDQDLIAARDAAVIDDATHRRLVAFLAARAAGEAKVGGKLVADAPRFDLTHLLWYGGAVIIMTAMGLFTNEAFNQLGGWALASIGAIYAAVFLALGHWLWYGRGLKTPGGLAVTVAVAMAPLIVYGIQDALDLWKYAQGDPGQYKNFFPYVHGSWIYMELATIAAAGLALLVWPFGFIVMPAAVALWFLSMDIVIWIAGGESYAIRSNVSVVFGLAMILTAWAIDLKYRSRGDFAFWLHLFGSMAFWGGLTSQDSSDELGKAIYCAINVGLLLLAVYLGRRVYAVFGAIGVMIYLGHLASKVFRDTLTFSFALSLVGLAVIGLGLWLHRHRADIERWMDESLPSGLKALRPAQG